ncbi:MAG: gluconolaconase, partial [Methylotenera sp.]|nr:gluconolaconase [Methylotenera sp.]
MPHTKITLASIFVLSALILGCQSTTKPLEYTPQKITGLKTPESVVQAKDGRIFVSEINGFGKDGDGQITVIDALGKASIFASGLDDPKGLAMIGQDLYVADKTKILKITPTGKVSVFVAAESFPVTPLFLN